MFERLMVGLLSLAVVLAAGWFYLCPSDSASLSCTCRELADHPAEYEGRRVRISTLGCQREGTHRLVWRRMSHESPAVVLDFLSPIPSPVPLSVVGDCEGVTVRGCRP